MTDRKPRHSGKSLSPFVSDDKVQRTLTEKQAAEPDVEEKDGQDCEVPPVPELHEEIRRPRVGRRPVLMPPLVSRRTNALRVVDLLCN